MFVCGGRDASVNPDVHAMTPSQINRSKKKGHGHNHPHHAHPPTAAASVAPEKEAEEEQEDVVKEQEEEEPAPVLLVGVPRVYSCGECRTHLASDMDVISRVGVWVGVGGVRRGGGRDRTSLQPTNQPT